MSIDILELPIKGKIQAYIPFVNVLCAYCLYIMGWMTPWQRINIFCSASSSLDYCGWFFFTIFNPHWHELWKQEKCSSLATPSGIFYKSQSAWHGEKIIRLMSIFTSKKFGDFWKKLSWQNLIQKEQEQHCFVLNALSYKAKQLRKVLE